MTKDEAYDVLILARWLGWGDQTISDQLAAETLTHMVVAAGRRAEIEVAAGDVLTAFERLVGRLRGSAEAEVVCEALARHVSHNGAIPWPSIERPFNDWKATRATT